MERGKPMDRWHCAFALLALAGWLVGVWGLWAYERRLSAVELRVSQPVLCSPDGLARTMQRINAQLEEVLRQWRAREPVV